MQYVFSCMDVAEQLRHSAEQFLTRLFLHLYVLFVVLPELCYLCQL